VIIIPTDGITHQDKELYMSLAKWRKIRDGKTGTGRFAVSEGVAPCNWMEGYPWGATPNYEKEEKDER
jgi:hypothetical protein